MNKREKCTTQQELRMENNLRIPLEGSEGSGISNHKAKEGLMKKSSKISPPFSTWTEVSPELRMLGEQTLL